MSITVPRSPIHTNNVAGAPNCGRRTAAAFPLVDSLLALLDLLASLCAGINRHDVENERVSQGRSSDPS